VSNLKEGYKNTELGVIPEDWEVKKLEEVANIIMGQSPKSDSYNEDKIGVPFFQGNSEFGRIHPTVKKWCSEPIKVVEPLDILISVRAPVGDVNINTYKSCIGRGLGAIRANNDMNYKYLFYVMANSKDVLNSSAQGSTFTAINSGDLRNHKIVFPPLKEQEKIAEILSTIDCQIDDTDKIIDRYEVLKSGLMQRLLSRGIGHSEFRKSEVGEIPASWEVKKIGEITEKVQDGNYGNSYPKNEEFIDYGVPFITSAAIGDTKKINEDKIKYISIDKHMELSKAHIEIDDVLFTNRGANSGEVALVNKKYDGGNIGPQLTLLRSSKNIIISKYLFYYLQSNMMIKQFNMNDGGSAMNFFSISTTKSFKIAYPNLEEQNKIAEILSSVDNEIEEYKNNKQKLEELKKGLMQQLLTGKIRTI